MVDGKIIGAIGVSGALSSQDEQSPKPAPTRWRNQGCEALSAAFSAVAAAA